MSFKASPSRNGRSRQGPAGQYQPVETDGRESPYSSQMAMNHHNVPLEEAPVGGTLNYSPEETNPLAQLFKSSHPMIPFAVVTVLYLLFDVRIELFLCVALFITSYKANTVFLDITRCKKNLTLVLRTLQMMAFLLLNIILMLFVYRKIAIHRIFIFLAPKPEKEGDELDIFDVIFLVASVDFIIKFATIIIKGIIYCTPSKYLGKTATTGKGWLYHSVELASQVYRSVVPMGLWIRLLIQMNHWSEYIFFTILIVIAVVFKGFELKGLFARVKTHVRLVGAETHRITEVTSNRATCPICLDELREPRITSCMHVFCCKCIHLWCDRDSKCPVCRTELVTIPIEYRDGSTAQYLQLF